MLILRGEKWVSNLRAEQSQLSKPVGILAITNASLATFSPFVFVLRALGFVKIWDRPFFQINIFVYPHIVFGNIS